MPRLEGCQSTNHEDCYEKYEADVKDEDKLWECAKCHRKFCWEDGSGDDRPELCDDCCSQNTCAYHEPTGYSKDCGACFNKNQ